ncbi:MAG: AMP phosphorylase [Candidatus Anstonellales archaeon]
MADYVEAPSEREKKEMEVWKYKKYICQVKTIDIFTGKRIIVLNDREAMQNEIYPGQRIGLRIRGEDHTAIVDLSSEMVKAGEIGVFKDVAKELDLHDGDIIEIQHIPTPVSLESIRKKLDGNELSAEEIESVISDLMANKLDEPELAMWIASTYVRGMTDRETVALTNAIAASGEMLQLGKSPIVDKHCIGGVAGNRTTMVIVPIVAAAGLYIAKTSSRAITSAAGTADTMEVFANVNIKMNEMRDIVSRVHGAIVWGGGINIASADDKLIKIRRPLSLDPKGVLLASILAKKKAVGAEHVVIDIPVGIGAKIEDLEKAKELANDFIKIGKMINMNIDVLITDGSEPVGNGIGPALEARDVLQVLEGRGPEDLKHKSLLLAGKLLEMAGKVAKGDGYAVAEHFILSGKALKKMREIIEAQGGNPNITSDTIPLGEHKYSVKADRSGKIAHIDNKKISKIARAAGAPTDKGAGIYLYRAKGDRVEKGDILFDIYAESEEKLDFAIKALDAWYPIEFQRVLLGEISQTF